MVGPLDVDGGQERNRLKQPQVPSVERVVGRVVDKKWDRRVLEGADKKY